MIWMFALPDRGRSTGKPVFSQAWPSLSTARGTAGAQPENTPGKNFSPPPQNIMLPLDTMHEPIKTKYILLRAG